MHRIIYHQDADGYASAIVVYKYLWRDKAASTDISLHPINYGMPLPEIDYDNDHVYLVDFSLQPLDIMVGFAKALGQRLTWIDHHDSSLQMEIAEPSLKFVPGVRSNCWNDAVGGPKVSACELCWKELMSENGAKALPPILQLIGDWDTWRHKDLPEARGKAAKELHYFLKMVDSDPSHPRGFEFWFNAFSKPLHAIESEYCERGKDLMQYQSREWENLMRDRGFVTDFAGYRAVVINQVGNSEMFDGFFDADVHDLMVTFQMVQGTHLTVSLYTPHTDRLHVGNLAKELGEAGDMPSGGGHAGAAGFQCGWPYFMLLLGDVSSFS